MRIISGTLKGKKVISPKDKFTRPLKDLTKESIFNIIQHSNKFNSKIKCKYIRFIFWRWVFWLECLSRGAKSVTFLKIIKTVIPILKKNISILMYWKNLN